MHTKMVSNLMRRQIERALYLLSSSVLKMICRGPLCSKMFFHAKITVITCANFEIALLKKKDEQFGSLATSRLSTYAKVFGNFGGLFGCRNPQK